MRRNYKVIGITLAVVIVAAVLTTIVVLDRPGASMKDTSLPSAGTIKAIDVGVYWNNACSINVSSIDWGLVEPGSVKNITVFLRNEGNAPITASLQTTNWNPANAVDHMMLSWNYANQTLSPDQVVEIALALSISTNIQEITSFSFDIVISAVG